MIAVVAASFDLALLAIVEAHNVLSLVNSECSAITGLVFGHSTIVAHKLIVSLDRCYDGQMCKWQLGIGH